jgi:carboxyl-terminal processing protease
MDLRMGSRATRSQCRAPVLIALALIGPLRAIGAKASDDVFQPLLQDGVAPAEVRGTWQSRGYGWILELTDRGLKLHQTSRAGCSTDPRTAEFVTQFAYRQTDAPKNLLVIVQYPGENRYIFDRLSRLPEPCTRTDWDAPHLFEHLVASYREQYAFFKERHFDWEQRVLTARPLVRKNTSPRVLLAIFSDLLDSLGDAHVGLNATFHGEPVAFRTGRGPTLQRLNELAATTRQPVGDVKEHWLAAYNRGVRQVVLQGDWQETSNGKVVWGRVGKEIGYINVSSVEDFTPGSLADNIRFINDLMDRILGEFAGVRAVILDVTNNTGGYDRLAREIAGHFADQPTPAYTKRAYGAVGTAPDVFYVHPSGGRRFNGPTYLLTSDVTVSGGEILTLAMRVLPNVTQIGTPTRGALSDRLTKVLPDGSDFSVSNEIYLDPSGKLYEALGIPPQRALEIFPANDLEGGHAKAVNELVHLIRVATIDGGASEAR